MRKWCGAKHLLSQRGATSSWKAVAYVEVGQSSIGPHTPLSGGHFVRQGWSIGEKIYHAANTTFDDNKDIVSVISLLPEIDTITLSKVI